MKFCRVSWEDKICFALEEGDHLTLVEGNPFLQWRKTNLHLALEDARFHPPSCPSKIIAVGRNYRDHAAEMGNELPKEPLLFLKPPSALIGHEAEIVYPPQSKRVDYEGELGVVIGKHVARLTDSASARAAVFGYTIVNDVTARDLQKADVQFTRAKGFDTFCPVGPFIETELDPDNVVVETCLNGEQRQHASTATLAFKVDTLVQYISNIMTLEPGDLISTGTPAGVGPMNSGDIVEVKIDSIGTLRNRVL
ncbi:MAG: fumarylacetoacetate hydrolase family protein [Acidobacteriia bacterium]|nr:fumarylacetoacetate hydrolase family protein [Terriglobia bacterium]